MASGSASPRRRKSRKPPRDAAAGADVRRAAGADRPRRPARDQPSRPGRLGGARQARSQADVVAVTAEERSSTAEPSGLRPRRRERRHRAGAGDRRRRRGPGARRQRRSGRSAAPATRAVPRSPRRCAAIRSRSRVRARRSVARSSPPPSRWFTTRAVGAVRITQSTEAVNRAVRNAMLERRAAGRRRPAAGHRSSPP